MPCLDVRQPGPYGSVGNRMSGETSVLPAVQRLFLRLGEGR